MKLAKAYEILVSTLPMLTKEGLLVLETVFFDTSSAEEQEADEDQDDAAGEENESSLRRALIGKLQSTYQEAWLLTLAKVPHKKSMIKRTLADLSQLILPNFT